MHLLKIKTFLQAFQESSIFLDILMDGFHKKVKASIDLRKGIDRRMVLQEK